MTSRYDGLRNYLAQAKFQELVLGFPEIEELIGGRLPKSAERPQWWANQAAAGHAQREAWRATGYDAFLVAGSSKVKFRRNR